MPTSRDFGEFSRRLFVHARRVTEGLSKVIRGTALVIDQVLVTTTPVDTGRARANWIATVGAPAEGADLPPDPTGQAALAQAQAVVGGYRLEMGPLFISNNVPYIGALDNGHSKQAPHGMTAQALAAGRAYFEKNKVLEQK